MKLALTILVALGGAASAGPLAAKWRVAGCPDLTSHRTPTELVAVDRKAKTIVRRDLTTGAMLPALPLAVKGKSVYLAETTGDTLVLANSGSFVGVDAATGKQRWTAKGSRALRIDDDLVVTTETKGKVTVQRLAGKTGVKAWSVDVAASGALYSFAQDGAHVLVGLADAKAPAFTIAVVDAKTGVITWMSKLPIKSYHGALLGSDAVVVEEPTDNRDSSTYHILDVATGDLVAKASYKNAFAPILAGGRLFVGFNDLDKHTGTLVALDVKTGKSVWTTPVPHSVENLAGVTTAGLVHTSGGMVQVFDVATGKLLAAYGAPTLGSLELGARGGPLATLCDGKETLALDLGGTAETAKVSGKVVCNGCSTTTLPIHIGDTAGMTDDKGAFALTVTGAGRFEVVVDLEENGGSIGGSGKFVLFNGKGPYDLGTIKVTPPVLGD
jgi:outer membrane protein assembly factor BamB